MLVAAEVGGFRRMPRQTQRRTRPRRNWRGTIADGNDRRHAVRARVLHHLLRRGIRLVELQRQRAVLPRVIEFVAAVAAEYNVEAKLLRGGNEGARLVPRGRGEQQQAAWRSGRQTAIL